MFLHGFPRALEPVPVLVPGGGPAGQIALINRCDNSFVGLCKIGCQKGVNTLPHTLEGQPCLNPSIHQGGIRGLNHLPRLCWFVWKKRKMEESEEKV